MAATEPDTAHRITIGGAHSSPYSLKMRAVLRYRRIPFRWVLRNSRWDDLPDAPVPIIPVLVFPCLRGLPPAFPNVAVSSYYGSIYPSVQNFLLGCRAVGLGAALITLPLLSTFAARLSLGLPWNVTPCCVIPVGWPIGRYGPTTRRPVEDVVSIDRYGNRAWQR